MTTSVTHKGTYTYRGAAVVVLAGLWLLPQSLGVHAADRLRLTAKDKKDAAQAQKAIQKEIQAVYAQQSAALSRKDVSGFLALCTPDYQDLARGKILHSAGFIRQTLPRTLAKYSTLAMTAAIKTLEVRGKQATVTATHHVKVTFPPRYATGAPNRSSETVTEDLWIKTDKGWRTKHTTEIDYKRQTPLASHPPTTAKPVTGKKAAPPGR